MFQDVYPQREVIRRRKLAVPARLEMPLSHSQSVRMSKQTVITDVVVSSARREVITSITETTTSGFADPLPQSVIQEVIIDTSAKEAVEETALPDGAQHHLNSTDLAGENSPKTDGLPEWPASGPSGFGAERESESSATSQRNIGNVWQRWLHYIQWTATLCVVGFAGYVSVDGYLANQELKRRLEAMPAVAVSENATPEQRQSAEGTDETEPTADAISRYIVAADMPRLINIPSISVRARVLQMGLNPDGSMQAPVGIFDAGWYNGSSRPGTRGAAVIDAHASGPTRKGLFAYLNTLNDGDIIEIERGDGSKLQYKVIEKETVGRAQVDMRKVMSVQGGAEEGLNLITCDGSWVGNERTFSDRTIVYTQKI